MKKIVFSLLFFAFCAFSLSAQNENPDFRFGVQISPSWSWMGTSDKLIEGAGANWGAKLQVMAEKNFAGNYYLTSGLGFSFNQGGTLQNGYEQGAFWTKSQLSAAGLDTISLESKLHYRLTYIEVPFGLKMLGGTGEDSRFRFYAEAPVITLGFLSRAKGDLRGNTRLGGGNTQDEDVRDDVNGLSLSWGLGGGLEYELSENTRLVTGLNFQKNFTDVTGNSASVQTTSGEWKKDKSKATISMLTWRIGIFF